MDLSLLTDLLQYAAYAVGFMRLVMKPIMDIIREYVKGTDTPKDDELLDSVTGSGVWKAIVWLFDYLGSIKIPATKKAVAKALGSK